MRSIFYFLIAVLVLRLFFPEIAAGLEQAIVNVLALVTSVAGRASAGGAINL